MNIVKENLENQSALLKISVAEPDYKEAVDNQLKTHKRKANIPGFRPGMAPMGIINKMYRRSAVAEESYRTASQAMIKYLEENKIEILGEPMPADSQPTINFDTDTSFEFHFELGLAPKVELDLSKVKVTCYKIKIDDKMRQSYKDNYLRRFGSLVDVDKAEKEEALTVTLSNDDQTIEDAYVGLIGMTEEARKPFIGKSVGDTMDVDVNELYPQASQRASILAVKEDELEGINPKFTLTITRIRKFANPELDEKLFKEAFPDGSVTTAEQFESYVDEQLDKELNREAGYKFSNDVRSAITKAANLTLPEPFLKKWLHAVNEGKFSMEEIEKEFSQFVDMMSWDVLKRFYMADAKAEVSADNVKAEAKNMAAMQFAYYGMPNADDAMLENYVGHIMGNKEEVRKIYDRLYEQKIIDYIATQITQTTDELTSEKFAELVKNEQSAAE